jgi:hypothetical protein
VTSKVYTGKQPILFNIIETMDLTANSGEEFKLRLLCNGDSWGVDSTLTMNPVFGYNEESARKVYKRIGESYNG